MIFQFGTRDPHVRRLPYPYQGALTISNDADFCGFEFFEELMRYLNTTEKTSLGLGLGLEVTSSLFFYSVHPYNFSYFDGAEPRSKRSKNSARIDEYLRSGWLDTIHAYGDFDGVGGCVRAHAETVYETLAGVRARLPIFSNHGGAENNQNVMGDAPHHQGDLRDQACYHSDLMKTHGVRFVWTESMMWDPIPGESESLMKRLRGSQNLPVFTNCDLRDGNSFQGFQRLRGTGFNAPNLSSLGYQLGLIPWDEFYQKQGAVVVYQHLGILQRLARKCQSAAVEDVMRRPEVYLSPFRHLKSESDQGRLWVSGTGRLLAYLAMVEKVRVQVDSGSGAYVVLDDQIAIPDASALQGLTIYVDVTQPVRVLYQGKEIPVQLNGPDESGRYSATVPFSRLENIWTQ